MRHTSASALRRRAWLWVLGASLAPLAGWAVPSTHEDAVANGDTRTLTIYHVHTKETTSATFRVNGRYDPAALEKLNWALRDWRRDEPTKIDPKLFDVAWEVQRDVGSTQPIQIMSAFRSPETNAMLRRRSRAVAEYSQHMLGKAMDVHLTDVPMSRVRDVAMRLQRGGVGYYPTSGTPFVHMDVGGVRYWPRMSRPELARIFPDGKTVDIPSDGRPMERYQEALAEIQARGGSADDIATDAPKSKNLLAMLFGGDEEAAPAAAPAITPAVPPSARTKVAENIPAASAPAEGTPTAALDPAAASQPQRSELDRAAEVPLPVAKPRVLAENDAVASDAGKSDASAATVPLPPPRPADVEQPVVAANVPVPPVRPTELGGNVATAAASAQDQPAGGEAAGTRGAKTADAVKAIAASSPVSEAAKLAAMANLSKLSATARPVDVRSAPVKKSDGKLTVVAIPPSSARLAARVALPALIMQGEQGSARPLPQPSVLAFAETPATRGLQQSSTTTVVPAQPAPRRRPAFVAARIDRSNFRTLTAAAPTERSTSYTAQGVGSAMAPMRAAAQSQRVAAIDPSNEMVTTFAPRAPYGELKCGSFTGPAVKALTVADRFSTMAGQTQ